MRDQILHEIALTCHAEGLTGDLTNLLNKPPLVIASSLQQLRVSNLIVGIVASWGKALTDKEVLQMLKSINDKGAIR
ncbi:hypothetical protein GO755_27580 [Spirosoma sp. HMF4905]|uniref:Uncharacterized protein n=1 Tax=Spirosoma arboris TaxID=2682092 RepID=A0A7K1SJ43_9BACT|nr:hypothetical protein [Spirosoma arboris]MVM33830.1 hypothetical protein [Spirosoma arboris]